MTTDTKAVARHEISGIDVLAAMDSAIMRNGHRGDNQLEIQNQREARDGIAELIEVAGMIERCAYDVSTEIDPRGHRWSEAYLDEVLPALRKALVRVKGGE